MPTRIESSLIIGPWQAVTPPCHWICRRPSASPMCQSSRCHDCSSIFGQHYTKLQIYTSHIETASTNESDGKIPVNGATRRQTPLSIQGPANCTNALAFSYPPTFGHNTSLIVRKNPLKTSTFTEATASPSPSPSKFIGKSPSITPIKLRNEVLKFPIISQQIMNMQEHNFINGNAEGPGQGPNGATPPNFRHEGGAPWPMGPIDGVPPGPPVLDMPNGHGPHEFVPPHGTLMPSEAGPGGLTPNSNAASNAASKKSSSRRNAWGNLSYADLITQAINSSPEKRLTLSQVYEWMVANISYFKDKGDSNSSAGWKNSIRHNLSLHSKFVRVQNEGTGKSSWWMLNPDAKPGGKTSRRRTASVEGSNSNSGRGPDFKRRGRNRKAGGNNANILRNGGGPASSQGHHLGPVNGPDSTPSPNGPVHPGPGLVDLYPESPSLHHQYPFGPSGGRMSPTTAGMIHPDNHPAFGYPGQQEWAPGEYQMNAYYPGQNRGYCDSLGSSGTEVEYPGAPRPMSPTQQQILQQQQQQQRNGFPYSRSFPSPSTPSNGGNENFHPSFHADKLPNHSLAEASTFPSIQQVMSPTSNSGAPNSSLSPSGGGGNQRNDSGGGGPGSRTFSSPDAHRPGSANNEPPISPHHNLPSQFFFPPQGQPPQQQQQPPMQQPQPPNAMKPSSPGSPGSVKSAKSNNNGSILERALASHVKQEGSQVEGGQHMMASWPPQQPQPPAHHIQYDLGSEVFMKPEIDISGLDYDMHYSNAMASAASGVHQGHPIPQGHLGPVVNRGQEDHLHSPASGYNLTAAQQPPWVR